MKAGSFLKHGWETIAACIHPFDDEHAPRPVGKRLRFFPDP